MSGNPRARRGHRPRSRLDSSINLDGPIIRIYPTRIISFGIDEPDQEPHQLTANSRNVTDPPRT